MKATFFSLFNKAIGVVNSAIMVIIGLALVGFFWGIVKLLFSRDNEVAKKEGREFMMYGVLTLFVMTSFWGLVNLLNGTITVKEKKTTYIKDPSTQGQESQDPQNTSDPFSNIQDQLQDDPQYSDDSDQ
ncbi:MAG: hypothetical protein RLZZ517_236 [Candidatus Parcubacteria bacterium]|jgi:hypothetical protein